MQKTVYIGTIVRDDKTEYTVLRASRHEAIQELNNWFFDYFRANKQVITQLPPLDDWDNSEEDSTLWYIEFPVDGWQVIVRSENIWFK